MLYLHTSSQNDPSTKLFSCHKRCYNDVTLSHCKHCYSDFKGWDTKWLVDLNVGETQVVSFAY